LEGVERAPDWPFRTEDDRSDYERVEGLYGRLVATVDPDDPWSHPEASRLDGISIGGWLRSVDAPRAGIRALETGALALADGSIEGSSLLGELRKWAAAREEGFYSDDRWESMQVAEGSAEVASRIAAGLGERVRLASVVSSVSVSQTGCTVRLADGEELRADA